VSTKTPWGHCIASHYLLGWCARCPGRDALEELAAWQVWAGTLPDVSEEISRQQGGDPARKRDRPPAAPAV
jgi:hypothetical protein